MQRYAGGEGICTTSVHPWWHATGIIKGAEKALNKHGIFPDPPSNVSDAIVEQVLKGRSGRLVIPKSQAGRMGFRNYPRWIQDIMVGNVRRNKDRFEFGREDTKLIA